MVRYSSSGARAAAAGRAAEAEAARRMEQQYNTGAGHFAGYQPPSASAVDSYYNTGPGHFTDPGGVPGASPWGSPAPTPPPRPKGEMEGPGYGEQWYIDNKGAWGQPSTLDQYWNGVSGTFAAGPARSTGAQQGFDQWFNPINTETSFAERGAASGPRSTNYTSEAYGQRNTGPSYSEQFYSGGGPQFTSYGARAAAAGAPSSTFHSGTVFDTFFEPLTEESYSEQLYGQDPNLGTYYDRAFERGREKLDNAMAAKGMFASGAAADETRQLLLDLEGERANREADYQLRAAGQADSERRGRMGLASQMGTAADAASLGRSRNALDWASMLDDTELGQARERRAGREFADTMTAQRDQRNLDWADRLDDNALDASADARAWAVAGDRGRMDRSAEARSWADLLDSGSRADEQLRLDYLRTGGDLAGRASDDRRRWLESAFDTARGAENLRRNRYSDMFDRTMGVAGAKSGIVTGAGDRGTSDYRGNLDDRYEALLAEALNNTNLSAQDRERIERSIAMGMRAGGL